MLGASLTRRIHAKKQYLSRVDCQALGVPFFLSNSNVVDLLNEKLHKTSKRRWFMCRNISNIINVNQTHCYPEKFPAASKANYRWLRKTVESHEKSEYVAMLFSAEVSV